MEQLKNLIKKRLQVNNVEFTQDFLDYTTDEVVQKVLNFCNLEELPKELYYTVARMVGEVLDPTETPQSVRVGDTSVDFSKSAVDKVLNAYESELYEFRKVRW